MVNSLCFELLKLAGIWIASRTQHAWMTDAYASLGSQKVFAVVPATLALIWSYLHLSASMGWSFFVRHSARWLCWPMVLFPPFAALVFWLVSQLVLIHAMDWTWLLDFALCPFLCSYLQYAVLALQQCFLQQGKQHLAN